MTQFPHVRRSVFPNRATAPTVRANELERALERLLENLISLSRRWFHTHFATYRPSGHCLSGHQQAGQPGDTPVADVARWLVHIASFTLKPSAYRQYRASVHQELRDLWDARVISLDQVEMIAASMLFMREGEISPYAPLHPFRTSAGRAKGIGQAKTLSLAGHAAARNIPAAKIWLIISPSAPTRADPNPNRSFKLKLNTKLNERLFYIAFELPAQEIHADRQTATRHLAIGPTSTTSVLLPRPLLPWNQSAPRTLVEQ